MKRTIDGKNVAVVGGAGFLGSHLVNHLCDDRRCNVLVIDNLVIGKKEFINPRAKFIHHDITGSEEYLTQVLADNAIEYVFNYAAYPYVPDSYSRPVHVFNVNAMGAMKVINAANTVGCKGILQVSSAELYGGETYFLGKGIECEDHRTKKQDETSVVVPHSSYGASKAAVDAFVQVRWKEYNVPCLALRQFNCVGERETHPYVVPEIISQLAAQQGEYGDYSICPEGITTERDIATVKLGNNSSRDFMYAGDAVRMAAELMENGEWGEVYNLGAQGSIKIYDLATAIGKLMGFSEVRVEMDPSRVRPWEIWHLQSDNTKIHSVISHRAGTPLVLALRETLKYFKENGGKWAWES